GPDEENCPVASPADKFGLQSGTWRQIARRPIRQPDEYVPKLVAGLIGREENPFVPREEADREDGLIASAEQFSRFPAPHRQQINAGGTGLVAGDEELTAVGGKSQSLLRRKAIIGGGEESGR